MTLDKDVVDSLRESRRKRAEMKRRFGFMPTSVLRLRRGALHRSMYVLQQEQGSSVQAHHNLRDFEKMTPSNRAKQEALASVGAIGSSVSQGSKDRKQASIMAAELVDFCLLYYANAGDVYVDPFMGQGVQMQVAWSRGVHYHGCDICEEYVAYIQRVRDLLLEQDDAVVLNVERGDARSMTHIEDGIGDFGFTSPPYWDVEYYGPEAEQLGTGHTYEEFLGGIADVAATWRRKMKPGARVAVNVNDFRRNGKFYSYHSDTSRAFEQAGWTLEDIWIVDGLVGGLPRAYATQHNERKRAPKVHEYLLVFSA